MTTVWVVEESSRLSDHSGFLGVFSSWRDVELNTNIPWEQPYNGYAEYCTRFTDYAAYEVVIDHPIFVNLGEKE